MHLISELSDHLEILRITVNEVENDTQKRYVRIREHFVFACY